MKYNITVNDDKWKNDLISFLKSNDIMFINNDLRILSDVPDVSLLHFTSSMEDINSIDWFQLWWACSLLLETMNNIDKNRISWNECFYAINSIDVIKEFEGNSSNVEVLISCDLFKNDKRQKDFEEDVFNDYKWKIIYFHKKWVSEKWFTNKHKMNLKNDYKDFLLNVYKENNKRKYKNILVFEWTDKSWKTSIANIMKNFKVIKNTEFIPKNRHSYYTFTDWIIWVNELITISWYEAYINSIWNYILDRWIPTNIVYSQVLRKADKEYIDSLYKIEDYYSNDNIINCIFLPNEEDAIKRCSLSDEDSWYDWIPWDKEIAKHINSIILWFNTYIDRTKSKCIVLDQTSWINKIRFINFWKEENKLLNKAFMLNWIEKIPLSNFDLYSNKVSNFLNYVANNV